MKEMTRKRSPFSFYKRRKKSKRQKYPPNFIEIKKNIPNFGKHPVFIHYSEIDEYFKRNLDYSLSEMDEHCLLMGRKAWDKAILHFHTPAISDPTFAFDKSKLLGFFIDLDSWSTMMNLSNAPMNLLDKELFDFYNVLALHEISHYIVCPYDAITNARLIKATLKKKIPERLSPIVVNFFADLVIDMKLFRNKPKEMEFQLRETLKMSEHVGKSKEHPEHSNFYKILIKCYEEMWALNLGLNEEQYKEITPLAQYISYIILKDFEDESLWEKKIAEITGVLKDYIREDFPEVTIKIKLEEYDGVFIVPGAENAHYPIQIPLDVQILEGNPLEIKIGPKHPQNTNKKKKQKPDSEDVKNAEDLANEMSLEEFIKVNRIMGFISNQDAITTYYRGISKNLVEFKVLSKKSSGSIPVGIEPWIIGDPIEELDIPQSLLVSPKVIPNVTTRKWIYREGPGIEIEKRMPDLMIVIDSSGSMNWTFGGGKKNKSPYHLALVSSFAALQYGIKKGVKMAVINFSDSFDEQTWTLDPSLIENVLLKYQGGGTQLPTMEIKRICGKGERKSLILLITDFEIYNWEIAFQDLLEILKMGNKIIAFFIGGHKSYLESPFFSELSKQGAVFYPIQKLQDLVGLVIQEVHAAYGD